MRSREEQIKVLAADFADPPESYQMMEVAELHIREAERRAEQRVRETIARDSDRLDWLAAQIVRVRERAPYQPIIINGTYDPGELRDAIDAAREAQG